MKLAPSSDPVVLVGLDELEEIGAWTLGPHAACFGHEQDPWQPRQIWTGESCRDESDGDGCGALDGTAGTEQPGLMDMDEYDDLESIFAQDGHGDGDGHGFGFMGHRTNDHGQPVDPYQDPPEPEWIEDRGVGFSTATN